MMKSKVIVGLLLASLLAITCGEKGDNVIGSRYHDIKKAEAQMPEILADGISTTQIIATVTDRNGDPADSMKVVFRTTFGSIDEFDFTDSDGEARVVLKSIASNTDLLAEVTATVVDTADKSLHKGALSPLTVTLSIPNSEYSGKTDLKKTSQSQSNTATINVKFLGITLSAKAEDAVLPADGRSETKVSIKLQETSSQKVIANAEVQIFAKYGMIVGSAKTDKQGLIKETLKAAEEACEDTICVEYGNKLSTCMSITYVNPKFELLPNIARIPADGNSTVQMVATLLTHKNTPIVGAEIKFSASAGVIPEKTTTNEYGQAKVKLKAGAEPDSAVQVIAQFLSLSDTATVVFVSSEASSLNLQADSEPILRDGMDFKQITVNALEMGQPLANTIVNLHADFGTVPETIITDQQGKATFDYIADAGISDATATVTATIGSIQATQEVSLIGISVTIAAIPDSIPADGMSTSQIRVEVKQTTSQFAVSGHAICFAADLGTIQKSATTDNQGIAEVTFTASRTPGIANITATCGTFTKSTIIYLFDNYPNSIVLDADPNFIWVKETGNLEQTIISATVLGVTGEPVGNDIGIKFRIVAGPGGGEVIEPAGGSDLETRIIRTVDGKAEAKIRAGVKSGTVRIGAELVDYPNVVAQTTNIIIRSGPPYIWIDPNDPNNVIQHASILVEPGKHNVAFGNPVQDINITTIFGDKYNNPVEKGTAVYFTTTGGIITTDAVTCDKGQAGVVLQNCNPFPYMTTEDANQLSAGSIPNPNDENVLLNVHIPDFEGGLIENSMGSTAENDGMAVIIAYTWGQNQFGNDVKVWNYGRVVYSSAIHTFSAVSDRPVIDVGEYANIQIRLFDIHGNPVAASSSLTALTTAGELSETSLMPSAEAYGWGTTYFSTQLINNLDPEEGEPTTAIVIIALDSPNGSGKISVPIYLSVGGQ